ncbi:MAG TPA: uroporphyrinogen decarboxylase family protein [Bacteroidota bacterium]|nr:uroporphyrinogen decarboxylase family protein [Bacteroidota bacterium]
MNGYERIAAALHGEWPDKVPIMLHNFQMAAYESGITMDRFRRDPHAVAAAFIAAVERYGYDGVLVDVDTVTLAEAAGVPVDCPEHQPARACGVRLKDLRRVRDLSPVDLSASPRVQVWLEATRLLKRHFGAEIFVRGNCDQSPFTLAALVRGIDDWMTDLLDPLAGEYIQALLDYCTGITTQFLGLMATAGADMLSNGDSTAGPDLVSPALYRRFAFPSEQRVVTAAHTHRLPYALHICGNTDLILEPMLATGADALELDYKTDAGRAHALMHHRTAFIGNIDPSGVLALGTPQEVAASVRALLRVFADTPRFILNAGCALPPETPSANLQALIQTAREFR